jgi:mannose-6-phosphate isomerase-like protein (cupin superfamily)
MTGVCHSRSVCGADSGGCGLCEGSGEIAAADNERLGHQHGVLELRGARVSAEPFLLQPGAGRSIDLGGFLMTVKAGASDTDGAFTLLEAAEPPHFGPPMHIHRDAAEAFYVLEGEYIIFIDEEETRCPAGSFVYIPAGAVHGFRVGDRPSKKLNLYVPQAMVGYFDELAAAIASGTADDATLGAIAEQYGMDVLGPVPEGYL